MASKGNYKPLTEAEKQKIAKGQKEYAALMEQRQRIMRTPGYDLLTAERRVEWDRLSGKVVAAPPPPPGLKPAPPPGLKPGLKSAVRGAYGEVSHGVKRLVKAHPYLSLAVGGIVAIGILDSLLPSKSDIDRYDPPRRTIDGVRHPTNQWDKLSGINTASMMPFTGVTYGSGRDIYAVRGLIPKFFRLNKTDNPILNTISGLGPYRGLTHSLGPDSGRFQMQVAEWHTRIHKSQMLADSAAHEITRTSYKYTSPSHKQANLLRQMHQDVIATPKSSWDPKLRVNQIQPMLHAQSTRFKPLSNRLKQINMSPGGKPIDLKAVEEAALARMGKPGRVDVMPRHLEAVGRMATAYPAVHTPRVLDIPIPMTEGIKFPFTATVSPLQLGKTKTFTGTTSNMFLGGYTQPTRSKTFMAGPVTNGPMKIVMDRPYVEGRMPVLKDPMSVAHTKSMLKVGGQRPATYPEPHVIVHRSVDPASLDPVGFGLPSLPGIRPSVSSGMGPSFSGGAVPTIENYMRVVRRQDIPFGGRIYPGIRYHSPRELPVQHGDIMPGMAKDLKWFQEGYDPRFIREDMYRFITEGGLDDLAASQEMKHAKGVYGELARAAESGDKAKYRELQKEARGFEKKLKSHMLKRYDTSVKFWKGYDKLTKQARIDVFGPLDPKIQSRIMDKYIPEHVHPDDIFNRRALEKIETEAGRWVGGVAHLKKRFSVKYQERKGLELFTHNKRRVDRLIALATDDYRFRSALQRVIERPGEWSPTMTKMVDDIFGGDKRAFQDACRELAVEGEGTLPRSVAKLNQTLQHFDLVAGGAKLGGWTRSQPAAYGVHYTLKHYDTLFDDLVQAGFSREQSHNMARNLYKVSPISSDVINELDSAYVKIRKQEMKFYDPLKRPTGAGAVMGPSSGFGSSMARFHAIGREFKGFWSSLASIWKKQPAAGRVSLLDKLWKTSQVTLGMPHSYAANAFLQKKHPNFVSLEEYDKAGLKAAQMGKPGIRNWAVKKGSAAAAISREFYRKGTVHKGPRGFFQRMAGRAGSAGGRTLSRVGMSGIGSMLVPAIVGYRMLNIPSQAKTYDCYTGGLVAEMGGLVAEMSVFTLSWNMFNAGSSITPQSGKLAGFAKFSNIAGRGMKFVAKMGISGMIAALAYEAVIGAGHSIFGSRTDPAQLPPGQMMPFRPDYQNSHVLVSTSLSAGNTYNALEPTGMNMTPFGSGYNADNDPALWKPPLAEKPAYKPVRHPKTAGLVQTLWHNHKNSNRTLRTAPSRPPRQRVDRGIAV